MTKKKKEETASERIVRVDQEMAEQLVKVKRGKPKLSAVPDPDDAEIRRMAQEQFDRQQAESAELDARHPVLPNPTRDTYNAALTMLRRFFSKGERHVPTLIHWREDWYSYWGKSWHQRTEEDVAKFIQDRLPECRMLDREGTPRDFPVTPRAVSDITKVMKSLAGVHAHHDAPFAWMPHEDAENRPAGRWTPAGDKRNGRMVCRGQVVDMRTGKATDNHGLFIPNGADWEWDANAPEPVEWLKFLNSILGGHDTEIELLREWMGYVLSGDLWAQKALLIVGPPRGGKGVIGHVLTALLGKSMTASPSLASLGTDFGLAPLVGKRLCLISDARISNRADVMKVVETLLRVTAGDKVDVSRKFKNNLTLQLEARVMMLTNEMPQLYDNSNAFFRRFFVLSLDKSFLDKEDAGLLDRLLAELPGIAQWACAGYRALLKRGKFNEPESSSAATTGWMEDANPAVAFFLDCCDLKPGERVESSVLYTAYQEWCEAEGRSSMNRRMLSRQLCGWNRALRSVKQHGGVRAVEGCRLKSESQRSEEGSTPRF